MIPKMDQRGAEPKIFARRKALIQPWCAWANLPRFTQLQKFESYFMANQ